MEVLYVYMTLMEQGRKLMVVNRIFHDGLLGLQSYSRNEDDSHNLEAAGRSFVL